MSLQGKNVIITGATSGIGVQLATVLSEHGASVFIGGRRADRGAEVAKETNSTFHVVDVADEASNKDFFAAAEKHFGGPATVDYILLNAGVEGHSPDTQVQSMKIDTYDYVFNINVRGCVLGLQYGTPLLRQNGVITMTSSVVSVMAIGGNPIYAASKAAVDNLVKSYAAQFKDSSDERIKSLSVMGISPGLFASDMAVRFTGSEEGVKAAAGMFNPSGRPGQPKELAGTMLLLCEGKLPQYKSGDLFACDADTHFPLAEFGERLQKATAVRS